MLLGSNIFSALVPMGNKLLQLGDVVRYAQDRSGYSVAEWNELPEMERDLLLVRGYHEMRSKG